MSFNKGLNFSIKKPANSQTQKKFALNAVPPPQSLNNRVAPPKALSGPSSGVSKHGYSTMDAISSQFPNPAQYSIGKKRGKFDDEYFDDDDEASANASGSADLAYIPAPGSPSSTQTFDVCNIKFIYIYIDIISFIFRRTKKMMTQMRKTH